MVWFWNNPNPIWQWVGLAATFAGTVLSVAGIVVSLRANRRSSTAKEESRRAYEKATRLSLLTGILEVLLDLRILEISTHLGNVEVVATLARNLLGRVERYRSDADQELPENDLSDLSTVRELLRSIASVIASRQQDQNKLAKIRQVIGEINALLNAVTGRRTKANRIVEER